MYTTTKWIIFPEISKLNVGAAVIVKGGSLQHLQAKQPFEIQADEVTVEGASAPDYPLQKNASQPGVPSHDHASSSAYEYVSGGFPRALADRICNPPVFPGQRLCLRSYAADHGKRL